MKIISSKIIGEFIQIDERKYIVEEHEDDQGQLYRIEYLADAKTNVDEVLTLRATQLEQQVEQERLNKEAAQLEEALTNKLKDFLVQQSDSFLKSQVRLTDTELAKLRNG